MEEFDFQAERILEAELRFKPLVSQPLNRPAYADCAPVSLTGGGGGGGGEARILLNITPTKRTH